MSIDPTDITGGQSATLAWNTKYADTVSIEPGVGTVDATGSLPVSPQEDTTYTLTAVGPGGTSTAQASVTVTWLAPTATISITPELLHVGESATLNWDSEYATSVTISPDLGEQAPTGSVSITPERSATYTIIATGPGGASEPASASVKVTADVAPQPDNSFGQQYESEIPPDATLEAYDPVRFAVLTGFVQSQDGAPLADVSVGVLHHPEYGTARSDDTGRFVLPVQGGGHMVVNYEKATYITAQRTVDVGWQEFVMPEDVVLLQRDAKATTVIFDGNPTNQMLHQSTPTPAESAEVGQRALTLVFDGDNTAWSVDDDGNKTPLTQMTVIGTEFTTPESMPADLPPSSAFTYCVEMEADGHKRIEFANPVPGWIDNFLGFDVGSVIPIGSYNRDTAAWEAEENGVVVMLLDTDDDGIVDALDADGDMAPDDLNNNGDLRDEVRGLSDPNVYAPGATYWRFEVLHFTPWDHNWPIGLPLGAFGAYEPPLTEPECPEDDCNNGAGGQSSSSDSGAGSGASDVSTRHGSSSSSASASHSGHRVSYVSKNTMGYQGSLEFKLSPAQLPASVKRINLEVMIAGRKFKKTYAPEPNKFVKFTWDGKDFKGKSFTSAEATVKIGYTYQAVYLNVPNRVRAWARAEGQETAIQAREERTLWNTSKVKINRSMLPADEMGKGWTLSSHHKVDPRNPAILHKGDGSKLYNDIQTASNVNNPSLLYTVYDRTACVPLPETDRRINFDQVARQADGDLWVGFNNMIWRYSLSDSEICPIYGNPSANTSKDPLDQEDQDHASVTFDTDNSFTAMAVNAEGEVFLAINERITSATLGKVYSTVILKIDKDGVVRRVAGDKSDNFAQEDVPARDVSLGNVSDMEFGKDGTLYFAECGTSQKNFIRKLTPDGYVSTVAGTGEYGQMTFDVPATESPLTNVAHILPAENGDLYISNGSMIGKVSPTGLLTHVAGRTDWSDYQGLTNVPAAEAGFFSVHDMQFDANGRLLFAVSGYNYSDMVYRLENDGYVSKIYGCGDGSCESPDSNPVQASKVQFDYAIFSDLIPMPDGRLYIANNQYGLHLLSIPANYASMLEDGEAVYPDDNGLAYIMGANGKHLRTIDHDTGVTLLTFGYDANDRLTSITDRFNNATTIERNPDGVPTAIISPESRGAKRTELEHDANGNLIAIIYADGQRLRYEYDVNSLMTAEIDAKGERYLKEYDEDGRVTRVADPMGGEAVYTRTRDAEGRYVIQTTTAEGLTSSYSDTQSDAGGFDSIMTSTTGEQAQYVSSADGMSMKKVMPCADMEATAEYDYDGVTGTKYLKRSTRRTTICDHGGALPQVGYFVQGCRERVIETDRTYEDTDDDGEWDQKTVSVSLNGKTSTSLHDKTAGVITTTSPEGRTTTATYDPSTLLTSNVSVPGFVDTTFEYDAAGRRTKTTSGERSVSFEYDLSGDLSAVTSIDGRTTRYTRDVLGRVTEVLRPDNSTVRFEYDVSGNMTKLTTPSGAEHVYNYNAVNANDQYDTPLVNQYRYVYDLDRRLKQTQNPSGKVIEYVYDGALLKTLRLPEGDVSYAYDCGSKLSGVSYNGETATYTYNGPLLTSVTQSGTMSQALRYNHNDDFKVVAFDYADKIVTYNYDNDGLLTGVGDYTITRNALNGQAESVGDGTMLESRVFNEYGELASKTTSIAGADIYTWSLERDTNGRITKKTEVLGGATQVFDYLYDDFGRLLEVKLGGAVVESYTYGPNGARISETNTRRGVTGKAYAYSEEDHLLTAGGATYEYDVDGFLTKKTENGQVTHYTYSTRGALLRVIRPDGKVIEYVVDHYGRRIAKKVDGLITEKYLWQGLTRLLAVFDGNDALQYRFEYGGGRMPVAVEDAGVKKYLVYDQVGSLRAVADAGGNLLRTVECDSFGNILSAAGEAFDVFAFAGGLYDADTGLIRFGYRDYDPSVGRWTAKDPIGFAGGDSDLYGYCHGDPVGHIDIDGLQERRFKIDPPSSDNTFSAPSHGGLPSSNAKGPGSCHPSIDAAVKDALDDAFPKSKKTGNEYGGTISKKGPQCFSYPEHQTSNHPDRIENFKINEDDVAWYHTHPWHNPLADSRDFSDADKDLSNSTGIPGYMRDPDGNDHKYSPNSSGEW